MVPPSDRSGNGDLLQSNYRVTLSAKREDKPLGEISFLTCSQATRISGPVNAERNATTINASGTLAEREDGTLAWTYALEFSIPIDTPGADAAVKAPGMPVSSQFSNHITSGALIMKPGQSYELLKMGGVTYSVIIAPEGDKKK